MTNKSQPPGAPADDDDPFVLVPSMAPETEEQGNALTGHADVATPSGNKRPADQPAAAPVSQGTSIPSMAEAEEEEAQDDDAPEPTIWSYIIPPALAILAGSVGAYAAWHGLNDVWPGLLVKHAFQDAGEAADTVAKGLPHCAGLAADEKNACLNPATFSNAETIECIKHWGAARRECIVANTNREDALECRAYLVRQSKQEECVIGIARKEKDPFRCLELSTSGVIRCVSATLSVKNKFADCEGLPRREESSCTVKHLLATSIDAPENPGPMLQEVAARRLSRSVLDCSGERTAKAVGSCIEKLRRNRRLALVKKAKRAEKSTLSYSPWMAVASYCGTLESEQERDECAFALSKKDGGACLFASVGAARRCLQAATEFPTKRLCEHFEDNTEVFEVCVTRMAQLTQDAKHCTALNGYPRGVCIAASARHSGQCEHIDKDLVSVCTRRTAENSEETGVEL